MAVRLFCVPFFRDFGDAFAATHLTIKVTVHKQNLSLGEPSPSSLTTKCYFGQYQRGGFKFSID